MNQQETASSLRAMIEYYTELTVEEHLTKKINKDADKAWNKIIKLIDKLAEGK
jgi:hypothetical protein